ncbi:MAG: hypothetical protein R3Y63_12720 [Eubacteriales bacterium]
MDDIWKTLGIPPTSDIKEIRRAYGKASRQFHPEEDPVGFLNLKNAYEQAMKSALSPTEKTQQINIEAIGKTCLPKKKESTGSLYDNFPPAQDYTVVSGFQEFYHLYHNLKEQNAKRWMKYFTSKEFLQVFLAEGFLKEISTFLLSSPPIFVVYKYLYLVYQIFPLPTPLYSATVDSRGLYHLLPLQNQVPMGFFLPLSGTDISFAMGFQDYYALKDLLQKKENTAEISNILSQYHPSELSHRALESFDISLTPRLYSALGILSHFIETDLSLEPETSTQSILNLFVQNLSLSSSQFWTSQERANFAPLFQALKKNYPNLLKRPEDYWTPLKNALSQLQISLAQGEENQQVSLVKQFLEQASPFLEALYDKDFIRSDFLQSLIRESESAVFLANLLFTAKENPSMIDYQDFTHLLTEKLWTVREKKQRERKIPEKQFSFHNHLYLRYYLSVAFPKLHTWQNQHYPLDKDWLSQTKPMETINLKEKNLSLETSPYTWSYYREETGIYQKLFSFQDIRHLQGEIFWYYLPLSHCSFAQEEEIVQALTKRLQELGEDMPWEKLAEKLFLQLAQDYDNPKKLRQNNYAFAEKIAGEYFSWSCEEGHFTLKNPETKEILLEGFVDITSFLPKLDPWRQGEIPWENLQKWIEEDANGHWH